MNLVLFCIFSIFVTKIFCCSEFERNVITNMDQEKEKFYLLYEAHDTYTSMNFFEVIFNHSNYTDRRDNSIFIPDHRMYKKISEKYVKGDYLCEGQPKFLVARRIVIFEMLTNESAYGFFHACNLKNDKQVIVGIVTKDHSLFTANDLQDPEIGMDFQTKVCDCAAIKNYFIQQCFRKPNFSNFFVIFLLVSVVFVAILFQWLGSFIKVGKEDQGLVVNKQ